MTDPRWAEAYSNAWGQLVEFWQYRAALGTFFGVICDYMGMEKALVYLLFSTLTLDMTVRVFVLMRRQRSVCRGMKKGLPRYIQYLAIIVLSWIVQLAIELSLDVKLPVIDAIMGWLVLTDVASVLGHMHYLGWYVPAPLLLVVNGGRRKLRRKMEDFSGERMPAEQVQGPYTPVVHPGRREDDMQDAESCAASGPPDADCPHRRGDG